MRHLEDLTFRQLLAVGIQRSVTGSVTVAVFTALYHQQWRTAMIAMGCNLVAGFPDLAREGLQWRQKLSAFRVPNGR